MLVNTEVPSGTCTIQESSTHLGWVSIRAAVSIRTLPIVLKTVTHLLGMESLTRFAFSTHSILPVPASVLVRFALAIIWSWDICIRIWYRFLSLVRFLEGFFL